MSTRLAIVGASVRAAAQSALRAGFEVVGADLFADADLDGVCPITKIEDYPHGFVDWLAMQDVDAWMYTGALENYPDLVDQLAAIKPLWGVSGEALRRCRDPLELQEIFARSGVSFPETLSLGTPPTDSGVWLAKTYHHSAGAGVWTYHEHPPTARVYAQRFIEGTPQSALFAVSSDGVALLGIAEQLTPIQSKAEHPYCYGGSFGPIDLSPLQRQSLSRIGAALRESLQLKGLIGVDMVFVSDDAHVVEVNPRYTASVELFERAIEFAEPEVDADDRAPITCRAVACHAAACNGDSLVDWRFGSWEAGGGAVAGKRIVFAKRDVTISREWFEWAAGQQAMQNLADLPRVGEPIPLNRPVCTVLALTNIVKPMRSCLRSRVAEVEDRLYATL